MEKHTKYFISFIVLVFILIIGYQFYYYVIKNNFVLYARTSCDPITEACFAPNCSEDSDSSCEDRPYKKIEKLAINAPGCDLSIESCKNLVCEVGEEGCEITMCEENTLEEGESCMAEDVQAESEANITEDNLASTTEEISQ